jgi:hypothetical protein
MRRRSPGQKSQEDAQSISQSAWISRAISVWADCDRTTDRSTLNFAWSLFFEVDNEPNLLLLEEKFDRRLLILYRSRVVVGRLPSNSSRTSLSSKIDTTACGFCGDLDASTTLSDRQ